jgi:hypothetical protein
LLISWLMRVIRPLTLCSVVCRAVATTMKTITAIRARIVPRNPVKRPMRARARWPAWRRSALRIPIFSQDDRGDAARKGDEEAAGAEEDEEDRERAEEDGCERGEVAGFVRGWGESAGCRPAGWRWLGARWSGVVLGGWGIGRHDGGRGGAGSLNAEDGFAELQLVAGAQFDWSGDALAVDVGAVGGAEVLDDDGAVVGKDPGVAAGDAGVRDDQVRGRVLAAEDDLAVEGVLAAGPCAFVDDQ